jgi:DNA-directed RNA polymerase III subunit RPC4
MTEPKPAVSTLAPGRLSSLGVRPTPGGPAIGRSSSSAAGTSSASGVKRSFLPKQVARRSKEDRDKSAPAASKVVPVAVQTPTFNSNAHGRGSRGGRAGGRAGGNTGNNNGRGGKQGRGRGRFEPISTQAVGAFSSIGAYDGRRRAGPAFEITGSASVAEDVSRILANGGVKTGDDILDDPNAFNMTRHTGADTDEFFPVRASREETKVGDENSAEDEEDYSDGYEDVEVEVDDETAGLIKAEFGSDAAGTLTGNKRSITVSRPVRSKSSTPFVLPPGKADTYVSPEELTELKRVARDHKTIAKEFNISSILKSKSVEPAAAAVAATTSATDEKNKDGDVAMTEELQPEIEQKLFFFQMPVLAPKFEAPVGEDDGADDEDVEMRVVGDNAAANDAAKQSAAITRFPEGMAGKLRLHKSGKLTMLLGNIVMEVSQGTEAKFLQDVVVMSPEEQKAYLIGQVTRKMIVAPDVDVLLEGIQNL